MVPRENLWKPRDFSFLLFYFMLFITFDFQFLNAPFWLEKTSEDACNLSICMNGSPNMPFWLILELGSECIHYRTFTILQSQRPLRCTSTLVSFPV